MSLISWLVPQHTLTRKHLYFTVVALDEYIVLCVILWFILALDFCKFRQIKPQTTNLPNSIQSIHLLFLVLSFVVK